jgi:hypothetical protein
MIAIGPSMSMRLHQDDRLANAVSTAPGLVIWLLIK